LPYTICGSGLVCVLPVAQCRKVTFARHMTIAPSDSFAIKKKKPALTALLATPVGRLSRALLDSNAAA
jgi:hypothetical protein